MTQTFKCPAGHDSVDPDFCSECGNQLTPAASTSTADPAIVSPTSGQTISHSAGGENCPKCSEVRDGAAQYCGVCGYDFVSKTGGEVPQAAPLVVAAPSFAPPVVAAAPSPSSARIDLEVVVDGGKARKHSLFDAESLIGRPNNKAALSLTIDGDEGISRKQMIITRTATGATVRDLDSANGTAVERDGVKAACQVGEEKEIAVGDKIIIGEHTVITVLAINL